MDNKLLFAATLKLLQVQVDVERRQRCALLVALIGNQTCNYQLNSIYQLPHLPTYFTTYRPTKRKIFFCEPQAKFCKCMQIVSAEILTQIFKQIFYDL